MDIEIVKLDKEKRLKILIIFESKNKKTLPLATKSDKVKQTIN